MISLVLLCIIDFELIKWTLSISKIFSLILKPIYYRHLSLKALNRRMLCKITLLYI